MKLSRIFIFIVFFIVQNVTVEAARLSNPKRVSRDIYVNDSLLKDGDIVYQFTKKSIKDTYIRNEGLYENGNFGLTNQLHIGDRAAQGGGDRRIFIEFNPRFLKSFRNINKRIYFELYYQAFEFSNQEIEVQIHPVIESGIRTPWVEGKSGYDEHLDGVCWLGDRGEGEHIQNIMLKDKENGGWLSSGNHTSMSDSNRPEFTQPDFDDDRVYGQTVLGTQLNKFYRFDITELVDIWLSGEMHNYGFVIISKYEGPPFHEGTHIFSSAEDTDPLRRPRIVISSESEEVTEENIYDDFQENVEERDSNIFDVLRELKKLMDEGVITEKEFREKKKELLDKI